MTAVHYLAQMLLISLQRLERLGEYDGLTDYLLGQFADHPWERALLLLTTGAWAAYRRHRPVWAGALLAAATAVSQSKTDSPHIPLG